MTIQVANRFVYWTVSRAVDEAVPRDMDWAVDEAVPRDMDWAVYQAVFENLHWTVRGTVNEGTRHPALESYLGMLTK